MPTFTAWRHAAYDTPVRTLPSRRNGRDNTVHSEPTQYFALHPWGPRAELLRWEDRPREQDVLDARGRLWVVRLVVDGPMEIVGFLKAAAFGLKVSDLVADDYTACQDLARRARSRGAVALLVPSAALPGTENLVVLGPRVASPWTNDPVADVDAPAAVTADRAGPPLVLVDHVRWRGQDHAGLAAWADGRRNRIGSGAYAPVAVCRRCPWTG